MSLKIAYLGVYKQNDGYGNAAKRNILSLSEAGCTVVPRFIQMTNNVSDDIPSRIKELEQNDLSNVDVVIQHNLPDHFSYKSGVINVGAFAYETDSFPNNSWKYNLELMDQVVVFCKSQVDAVMKTCGVSKHEEMSRKTYIIPHAVDTDTTVKEDTDFGLSSSTTKFYTIAEYGMRKHLSGLLAAYFTTFDASQDVALIVKSSVPSRDQEQASEILKGLIKEIKTGTCRFANLDRYPKVILVTDFLSEDDIKSIHKECDIFVTASHGEAFCYPAMDALAFGNMVIAPNCTAFKDYIPTNNNMLVEGIESTVLGVHGAPFGLYSSDENWFNVNIRSLGLKMMEAHNNKSNYLSESNKKSRAEYINSNFSRKVIGERFIKEIIDHAK